MPDKNLERISELRTSILHIGDRLGRISSSRSVSVSAATLIEVCHKLLNCFQNILTKRTVSPEMENSMKQAFDEVTVDGDADNEIDEDLANLQSESSPQSMPNILDSLPSNVRYINAKENGNLSAPEQASDHPRSRSSLEMQDLTEDERVDLIVDRLYRKLSLTGIPPPTKRSNAPQAPQFDLGQDRNPLNFNNHQNIDFNPKLPPPRLDKTVLNPLLPDSTAISPRQFLDIYNWRLTYHGDEKDELPVERFLYRVQRMAAENGLTKKRLAASFSVLLRDKAQNWYWEFLETYGTVSWEVLSEAMTQRFQIRRTDDDVKQALERRKQKVKESFLDFYHSIRSISLSLLKPMSDAEIINLVTQNMRGGLQEKFAGHRFINISEMVNQCVTVEDTWSRIGWTPEIHHQARTRQVNELDVVDVSERTGAFRYSEPDQHPGSVCAVTSPRYFDPTGKRNTSFERSLSPNSCWNCFAIGHYFKDCMLPVKHRFCFGCGNPNTLKSQCHHCKNRQSGNSRREFRSTGILNSQTATNSIPRRTPVEVATNTDPEAYQAIPAENAKRSQNN